MIPCKIMDCNAYHILITGYIDGELSGDEMQMLKIHLQTCEACLAYLKRLETMKTALKRYNLLQEVPDVPADFAHNILVKVQKIRSQEDRSVKVGLKDGFRNLVLNIVERWTSSLKTRPFTWVTSMSFLLVFLAGVVFVDVFRMAYKEKTLEPMARAPKPAMKIAAKDEESKEKVLDSVTVTPAPTMPLAGREKKAGERDATQFSATVTELEDQEKVASDKDVVQFSATAPELEVRHELPPQTPVVEDIRSLVAAPEPADRSKICSVTALKEEAKKPLATPPEPLSRRGKPRSRALNVEGEPGEFRESTSEAMTLAGRQYMAPEEAEEPCFSPVPVSTGMKTLDSQSFQSVADAQKHLSFPVLEPRYIPPGFVLSSIIVSKIEQGDAIQLIYTDGKNTLSVTEENRGASTTDSFGGEEKIVINYPLQDSFRDGKLLKVLNWHSAQGIKITLVGGIADSELLKIASSIP